MKVNSHLPDIYRKDTLDSMKSQKELELIRLYDNYRVNPMLSYFTVEDINYIHKLAISPSMNCDVMEKYRLIGELMQSRGFKLIGGGTNRRAYECIYDSRIVAKVATDQIGFTSNLREYKSQNVLKPFCCKVFEVSPCGTLAIIEKIVPIKEVQEFQKYAPEILNTLYFKIRNNNIAMEDIGTRSMKNWGYRCGFGPVLLDYPTMYVADPKHKYCKAIIDGHLCGGTLDYDEGFNVIVCTECGATYYAKSIAKKEGDDINSLLNAVGYQRKTEGVKAMKIRIIDAETKEVLSERNIGGKSSHVDATNTTFQPKVKHSPYSTTVQPVKKIRARIVDAETGEETSLSEESEDNDISNQYDNLNKTVDMTYQCIPQIPAKSIQAHSKADAFIEIFNNKLMNANGDNYPTDGRKLTTDELIEKLRKAYTVTDWRINENEAFDLYRKVSMATMIGECSIDDKSLGTADTYINKMLKQIMPYRNDMTEVFYMLINTVKNTREFINAIISYWNTLLEVYAFETDETAQYSTYCVYIDLYDKYVKGIERALQDYLINVSFGNNMTYNKYNIISIIGASAGELDEIASQNDYFYNEIDMNEFVTFTVSEAFAEQMFVSAKDINVTGFSPRTEPTLGIPEANFDKPLPAIVATEKVEVKDYEPVDVAIPTKVVSDKEETKSVKKNKVEKTTTSSMDSPADFQSTKQMSRNQQNRYGGKKGGKKNKKRR